VKIFVGKAVEEGVVELMSVTDAVKGSKVASVHIAER